MGIEALRPKLHRTWQSQDWDPGNLASETVPVTTSYTTSQHREPFTKHLDRPAVLGPAFCCIVSFPPHLTWAAQPSHPLR